MRLNTDADVAALIRAELGKQNVRGAELARRVGVPQRYMARRLAGEVPWRVAEIQEVADALSVPVERFLRDVEGETRDATAAVAERAA